jgi:hypothetical protein
MKKEMSDSVGGREMCAGVLGEKGLSRFLFFSFLLLWVHGGDD